jgi:hypothetical protein
MHQYNNIFNTYLKYYNIYVTLVVEEEAWVGYLGRCRSSSFDGSTSGTCSASRLGCWWVLLGVVGVFDLCFWFWIDVGFFLRSCPCDVGVGEVYVELPWKCLLSPSTPPSCSSYHRYLYPPLSFLPLDFIGLAL